MRILVVGAGATGGYFGARLAQAGRDVNFLVRPRRAATLRERGLRITGLGEDEVITPRLVTADELSSPYDLVLLSVKATALKQAIDDVAPAIGPQTAIVPFLNGMAHLDELNACFGARPVLGGVAKIVTTLNDHGDIVRLAPLATLTIGEQDGRPSPRVDTIHALLDDAGIDASVSTDIVAAMWHKWVFITTVSALTCLMRGTVGDVSAVPGGSGLGPAILAEAAAVSAAAGFPVPEAELAATTSIVTRAGSPFASSMYRDVVGGSPTEVEHVFGDLVTRARALSVATPLLDLATLHLRVHQHRVERSALEQA
ncbi:ketopantoate reductase family protein [Streptomyces sp. NPDC005407]|uniref:ketopantoate reductase family protein n=1 Tax=Streptomyces sp. NPDC005407 TaxID=3155340 RepID=UPI0033AEC66D